LSITIRTAVCQDGLAHFNVGSGIVADSNPEAEYEETLDKAAGFLAALKLQTPGVTTVHSVGWHPCPAGQIRRPAEDATVACATGRAVAKRRLIPSALSAEDSRLHNVQTHPLASEGERGNVRKPLTTRAVSVKPESTKPIQT
jgi:hypothetical protein